MRLKDLEQRIDKGIHIVSVDVDGTLIKDRTHQNLHNIELFRKEVRESIEANPHLVVLLNSGTSVGFVEGIIGIYGLCDFKKRVTRHICESGCFVLECSKHGRRGHDLTKEFCSPEQLDYMTALRNEVHNAIPEACPEWGMCYGLSYNASSRRDIRKLHSTIGALMKRLDFSRWFNMFISDIAVDIVPKPLGKAFALRHIAELYGVDTERIAHIGDSENDWQVYDIVGLPVAVSNANRKTQEFVLSKKGMVTESSHILGVCEFLRML